LPEFPSIVNCPFSSAAFVRFLLQIIPLEVVQVKEKKAIAFIEEFKRISGTDHVLYDDESLDKYAHDETEDL